ncbi:3-hydroxyacyl-CoA dehydrogenase [Solidesulfovibrio sp.]
MDTMIFNIKNFPVDLHRKAKIAAVVGGKTLKDWVIEAIKEKLEREEPPK